MAARAIPGQPRPGSRETASVAAPGSPAARSPASRPTRATVGPPVSASAVSAAPPMGDIVVAGQSSWGFEPCFGQIRPPVERTTGLSTTPMPAHGDRAVRHLAPACHRIAVRPRPNARRLWERRFHRGPTRPTCGAERPLSAPNAVARPRPPRGSAPHTAAGLAHRPQRCGRPWAQSMYGRHPATSLGHPPAPHGLGQIASKMV